MKYVGWAVTILFAIWLTTFVMVWFMGQPGGSLPGDTFATKCYRQRTVNIWPSWIHRTISGQVDNRLCEKKP